MGLEILVRRPSALPLAPLVDALAAAGLPSTVAMVDNVLQGPGSAPPAAWRDVRLRTPAGIVSLRRTPSGIAIVIFGNADVVLQTAQRTVAEAVRGVP